MLTTVKSVRALSAFRLGVAIAASLAIASPAVAHDPKLAFEMTVIQDAAYGSRVMAGKLADAISKISAATIRPSGRFFAETNLCVAYTKSGDFDSAERACDEAIALASMQGSSTSDYRSRIARRYEALALSNRGVLSALSGNGDSARRDFRDALELESGLSAPRRNLEYLELKTAQTVTSL